MAFNFSGGKSRRDIRAGYDQAFGDLQRGYDDQRGYFDEARGEFDQYREGGQKGFDFYMDLLGLNGPEARAAAQGVITSDPQWQAGFAADSNAMLRHMNARGQGAGGAAALAGQRVLTEHYGNAMNRYAGLGQQGMQASGAWSDLTSRMGDNAYGYGATRAGMNINKAGAIADTRGTLMNNVMGLGGLAIRGMNAMRQPPRS